MYVISPLSNCVSPQSRDSFMNYIRDIANVTYDTEPDTLSYAWFCSASDNDNVPDHFVRGFEVYKTVEANQVTHRSSNEYKRFRWAVQSEKLLEKPSDLRFLKPTDIGFLTRQPELMRSDLEASYVVCDEIRPQKGRKHELLGAVKGVATAAEAMTNIRSYWVLEYLEEYSDDTILLFQRFKAKDEYERLRGLTQLQDDWDIITKLSEWRRITTWLESGIGFLGR